MHDHTSDTELVRLFYRIQGVPECSVSFIRVRGGTLVTVGSGMRNLDRKRTEVVEACHGHRMIREKPLDTFPQGEPDTMAEFDVVEAKAKDFIQHFVAPRVAARIPTGGEGYLHDA